VLLEVGNLNNTVNASTLTDDGFQKRLVSAIEDAIRIFSETEQRSAN